mmetsp:Transcript_56480/g.94028  ORF Transcript_56480/g.94028 Transcript_56480/m.94028 type:complete len:298 (+) Transcript_56480:16-909(+)
MSHGHVISRETQKNTEIRKRQDRIIKFLAANRGPHSIHNIRSRLRIDLQSPENLAVKDALQMNEKVNAMGNTFEYKPRTPNIDDKRDLQQYLQNKPEGVDFEELRDAYVCAERDLSEWRKSGRIIAFMNQDTKKHILFWYFGRLRVHAMDTAAAAAAAASKDNKSQNSKEDAPEKEKRITMDVPEEIDDGTVEKEVFPLIGDSIISTWNDIRPPPTKEDLQHELEKVNLISGGFTKKRTRKKNAAAGKQKKRRKVTMSRLNLTNTHMLQNASLKKTMIAQNEKLSGGKERELPQIHP